MLLNLYFKTTCNIRPHFHGAMGGLKIEGPLYGDVLCAKQAGVTGPVGNGCKLVALEQI